MYAVVYGSEWEDISYFADVNKARKKLVLQSLAPFGFHPFIMELTKDDKGVYHRSKYMLSITDLSGIDLDKVKADPTLAYDLIQPVY